MKKYKICYGIILIIALIMLFTKGFREPNFLINTFSDNYVDGYSGENYLCILNVIIIVLNLVIITFLNLNKENKLNKKWLVFIILLIINLFIPLGYTIYSGGISGSTYNAYLYLWNILLYFK